MISSIEAKARFQADGDPLAISNGGIGEMVRTDIAPASTDLATLESNNMLMNVNNNNLMVNIEDFHEEETGGNINLNQVISSYTFQNEESDGEYSSHDSFLSDDEGEFDDNFYDSNGRAIMNYQQGVINETDVLDDTIALPVANLQQQVAQNLPAPAPTLNLSNINTESVDLANTDLLHPSFANNTNNPAIEIGNVSSQPLAIKASGGGSNRRSDLKYSSKTIAVRGSQALSKQEKGLMKRQRKGGVGRVDESNAFNQFAITDPLSGEQKMLTYNNIPAIQPTADADDITMEDQQLAIEMGQPMPFSREITAYNVPINNNVYINQSDFPTNQQFPLTQQQYNQYITYNQPAAIEAPMELQAIDAPRERQAIEYFPGLSRKQQQRRAIKSQKVRERRLTAYSKKKTSDAIYTPPIAVLKAIGAIPEPNVPVIPNSNILAIEHMPQWDKRLEARSEPLAITNDVLASRANDRDRVLSDLPALTWLDKSATPKMKESMRESYFDTDAVKNSKALSIIDKLNRQTTMIQKRPKYLGRRNKSVNWDLEGPELLKSIQIKRLAGMKRKYRVGKGNAPALFTSPGKVSRRVGPENYDPNMDRWDVRNIRKDDRTFEFAPPRNTDRMTSEGPSAADMIPIVRNRKQKRKRLIPANNTQWLTRLDKARRIKRRRPSHAPNEIITIPDDERVN